RDRAEGPHRAEDATEKEPRELADDKKEHGEWHGAILAQDPDDDVRHEHKVYYGGQERPYGEDNEEGDAPESLWGSDAAPMAIIAPSAVSRERYVPSVKSRIEKM
ncbi:hypothetical protein C0992_010836, partial [Termitomyces sp. T32_za158]